MAQFFTLLTQTGQAKMANAIALGTMIEITQLAVGDGGGSLPLPDSSREALINEVRRAPINMVKVDENNPNWLVVEQILPPDVGGWTIREVGVIDADGDLIGYGNYPETYKPTLDEGSGRTQTIRMVLEVSHTSAVTLRVDPSVVLATREYVDDHANSRNHPDATQSEKGMVQYGTKADHRAGERVDRAATPGGVYEAFRKYGLGHHGQAITRVTKLSEVTATGFYVTTVDATDLPPDSLSGNLIHQAWDGSDAVATQIFQNLENGLYIRQKSSGEWGGWDRVMSTATLAVAADVISGSGSDVIVTPETDKAALDYRIADQSKVNTGTNDSKFVTPKKLKRWASDWVKQATENVAGMLRVASHAQVYAGSSDETAITPKKLLFGVSFSAGKAGYVMLPKWLGGFVLQWNGEGEASGSAFPVAFPTAVYCVVAIDIRSNNFIGWDDVSTTLTKVELYSTSSSGSDIPLESLAYFAIGK